MSMNHHHQPFWYNNNNNFSQFRHPAAANEESMEKEHMFEKPLTPSDVGKLNRLVIPKQHAEKYFPLNNNNNNSSSSGVDSGLLLSFEDETGKCWKFRYSYWNSSQSYVLTKGWSRYVKEKRLDAGDVVVFGRDRADGDRMFIGWKRRAAAAAQSAADVGGRGAGGSMTWSPVGYANNNNNNNGYNYPSSNTTNSPNEAGRIPYQPDCPHAAGGVVHGQTTPNGSSKILRLFGVNLEYQPDPIDGSESLSNDSPTVSSYGQAQFLHCYNGDASYPPSYMEYNLSRDGNQMRYHQG